MSSFKVTRGGYINSGLPLALSGERSADEPGVEVGVRLIHGTCWRESMAQSTASFPTHTYTEFQYGGFRLTYDSAARLLRGHPWVGSGGPTPVVRITSRPDDSNVMLGIRLACGKEDE